MNRVAKSMVFRQLFGKRYCTPGILVPTALFSRSSKLSSEPITRKTNSEEKDKPIDYFGSNAASWRARQSHGNAGYGDELWYQPIVISACLTVFLTYFCILREENDVDAKLSMSLYDRIDGLEEQQLELTLKYNTNNGLPTLEVENRLKEIRANKP